MSGSDSGHMWIWDTASGVLEFNNNTLHITTVPYTTTPTMPATHTTSMYTGGYNSSSTSSGGTSGRGADGVYSKSRGEAIGTNNCRVINLFTAGMLYVYTSIYTYLFTLHMYAYTYAYTFTVYYVHIPFV